tara:strand:- start:5301 stop:5900 length:600 start_codon:yes stop_codon:yes gene_type:complete
MRKPKLTIELVPKTCHYTNVRSVLPTKIWDKLRKTSYKKANLKCEVCKDTGLNQGYKHRLECHEIWEYTSDNTQLLKGLISLCPKCHQAKHIGRSIAIGKGKEIFKHIAKVNRWTLTEVEQYVGACFQEHKERSKLKWSLNIKILIEKYGVDKNLITEDMRPKTPVAPPWKSKWKKKKAKNKKRKATIASKKRRPSKRK